MVIDCHVHVSALVPGHGAMSRRLLESMPFRFMRSCLRIDGRGEKTERQLERRLVQTINETPFLDAAVVLAFDAVHDLSGRMDEQNTHLYVTNDYVIELAARYPKMLFGASVHPYRTDALAELERCVQAGAVLLKWLPPTQGTDPSSPKCFPFYDALAHYKLPLLCHTGGEKSLPRVDDRLADPRLLEPALQRGVTVIMAHCGTRSALGEPDFLDVFTDLARRYPNCYGDTAALNLPMRSHAYRLLHDRDVRLKLVHGSDWPIIAIPPATKLTVGQVLRAMHDPNWMRRDVLIKQMLGFDDAYWHRAATILRMPANA